jgi:hypothetical protein
MKQASLVTLNRKVDEAVKARWRRCWEVCVDFLTISIMMLT